MAWAFKSTWVSTDKPTNIDFNNIAHDFTIWGGNVNASNNSLTNLAGLSSNNALTWTISSLANGLTITNTAGNVLQLTGNASGPAFGALIINQTPGAWGLYDKASRSYIATSLVIGTPTTGPDPNIAAPLFVHIQAGVNFGVFNSTGGITTLSAFNDAATPGLIAMQLNGSRFCFNGGGVGIGTGTATPAGLLQLNADSAYKPGGGSWSNSSDARIKTDVRPFRDGLATLLKINPVHYTYNGKGGCPKGLRGIGVVAQEVQKAVPYCVSSVRTKLQEEDAEETDLLTFNASALLFVLINAVKELAARLPAPA